MNDRRAHGAGEAGFTLVELLIAMVVIAVGVMAVLGGLQLGIQTGAVQRSVTKGELALRSFAEEVKAADYVDCADETAYGTAPKAAVADVEYWDGDTATSPLAFDSTCPADDAGLQRIHVQADGGFAPEGASATLDAVIVKRRP